MQEEDSARRLAILRGEAPPPLATPPTHDEEGEGRRDARSSGGGSGFERRKRKRAGEDDTDFEMRVARERAAQGETAARELGRGGPSRSGTVARRDDAPIVDRAGHIALFAEPDELAVRHAEKNEEAEKEAAKKRREMEDQYQMRFVNAAGRDGAGLTDGGPWYAKGDDTGSGKEAAETVSLNVFGREDPQRKDRAALRLSLNDPLAMMKVGAAKVRQLGQERKRDAEERERDLKMMRKEEKRAKHREKEKRRERREQRDRSRSRSRSRRSRSPERHHSRRHREEDQERRRDEERHRRGRRADDDRRRPRSSHRSDRRD